MNDRNMLASLERLTGRPVTNAKEQELKTMIRLLLAGLDSGHLEAGVLSKAREIAR